MVTAHSGASIALLALALAAAPWGAAEAMAQSTGLSCEGSSVDRSSGARLVTYRSTRADRIRLEAGRHWRFGPFDRGVYGFEQLTFFVDAIGPFTDGQSGMYGPADVIVRLDGAASSWFRLVPEGADRQARGALRGRRGMTDRDDMIRPATDERGLPLFVVTLYEHESRSESEWQHLIDLRPGRRRVPVTLDCGTAMNQGGCLTWDNQYGSTGEAFTCQWSAADKDFICRAGAGVNATWGGRGGVRTFPLLDPADPARDPERTSNAQVVQLARLFASPAAVLPAVTDLWGPVHPLVALPVADGGTLVLFGAAGSTSTLRARFIVVRLARDDRATVHTVTEAMLGPKYWLDSDDHREVVVPGAPEAETLSFKTSVIQNDKLGAFARVHVREQSGQAIYWVGLELKNDAVAAGALRLATDTSEYFDCANAMTPPNAIDVSLQASGGFRAELEVERAHSVDLFDNTPLGMEHDRVDVPPCPRMLTVTWKGGFVVEEQTEQPVCESAPLPRFVEISDGGEVIAVTQLKRREP